MDVQIKDIRPGLKNLNVVFIILEVGLPTITKENREVRSFRVADASACINLSVWDEPGQHLVPGDIVKLTRGYAAFFRDNLTLYTGKTGDLQKIGEFCMVFNEQLNMSEPNPSLAAQYNNTANNLLVNSNGPASNSNIVTNNGSRQPVLAPNTPNLQPPTTTAQNSLPPKPNTRDSNNAASQRYNNDSGNGKNPTVNRSSSRGRGNGGTRNNSRERR